METLVRGCNKRIAPLSAIKPLSSFGESGILPGAMDYYKTGSRKYGRTKLFTGPLKKMPSPASHFVADIPSMFATAHTQPCTAE
ncbi:hypothetical protein [Undibacterium terreum]|uniref:hypothetical protein n=1 Tax=Undibacterium terreum TaxID=1224302 RepID=UPI001667FB62|nr:hypothetical protein [Undibacterium terreum]